jgi:hypothetical protein
MNRLTDEICDHRKKANVAISAKHTVPTPRPIYGKRADNLVFDFDRDADKRYGRPACRALSAVGIDVTEPVAVAE